MQLNDEIHRIIAPQRTAMFVVIALFWSTTMSVGQSSPRHPLEHISLNETRGITPPAGHVKPIQPQNIIPTIEVFGSYSTCFNNPGGGFVNDDYGWTGTGEFVLSNAFTKLGGPLQGSGYSWVTKPGPPGTHYDTLKVSTVVSPYFDLTALSDVYVSFYHSMKTEPAWDFSLFQYSLDSGAAWITAGTCNDPSGQNWYGSCVYGNRCNVVGDDDCFEPGMWNILVGSPPPGENMWTSAGDCMGTDVPTGPNGWVFSRLRLSNLSDESSVQFRYLTFSDSRNTEDGWAFDCFTISQAIPLFFPGIISGNVYYDVNGNGQNDAEPPLPGISVELRYSNTCHIGYDTTDSNRNYSFDIPLPGTYEIICDSNLTFSAPISGTYSLFHPADGSNHAGNDFGIDFAGTPITLHDALRSGWNLVSLPLTLNDYSKNSIFPNAVSNAFAFEGSYVAKDPLVNNSGYWIKLSADEVIGMTGTRRLSDTVTVSEGWNLIGSFCKPVAVASMISTPPAIVTSDFFGYNGSYFYWVKTNQAGIFTFSFFSSADQASTLRIRQTGELPPPPPDGETSNSGSQIPHQFTLEQNYPNPFNPSTVIRYSLPVNSAVTLKVYNVFGQKIATLVNGMEDEGVKSVNWNAGGVPSGMYYYQLQTQTFTDTKKMILIK
jgi:hypothetical protein